jgi:predicted nucleic acid-binding protein
MNKPEKKSNWEKAETVLKVFAIIIAGCWAIYTFVYENIYIPSKEESEATVKVNINFIRNVDSLSYYMVTISIKNKSKITENFASSAFNVQGVLTASINDYDPLIQPEDNSKPDYYDQYYKEVQWSYFAGGRFLVDNTTIQPNKEVVSDRLIAVPKGKFKLFKIEAFTIQTKEKERVVPEWKVRGDKYVYVDICDPQKDIILTDDELKDRDILQYKELRLYMPDSIEKNMASGHLTTVNSQ